MKVRSTGIRIIIFLGLLPVVSCQEKSAGQTAVTPQPLDSAAAVGTVSATKFVNELDDPDRDYWQMPDKVLALFGDLAGSKMADIGAGTGYFTFRMAAKGANVLAVDIDSNFLEYIAKAAIELPSPDFGKIETRITGSETPSLLAEEVDGVLIVNTAYFLPNRPNYFMQIYQGLKKGGRLVVVDFKSEPSAVTPPQQLWISSAKLENELKQAGFEVTKKDVDTLPHQYMILAIKN